MEHNNQTQLAGGAFVVAYDEPSVGEACVAGGLVQVEPLK